MRVAEDEIATAWRLVQHGIWAHFRVPSHVPGVKNPDILVDGAVWELKSPRGASEKNTISEQFKSARGQAESLIIDLARCGLPDELALAQIKRRFYGQSRFKKVIVLDHDGRMTRLPELGYNDR